MKITKKILILSAFLIPFYFFRFSFGFFKTNILEIFLFFAFVSLLIESRFKFKKGLGYWPLSFLAVVLISIFFSGDKIAALGIFKGWFLAPVVFTWLIYQSFDREEIKALLWSLCVSGLIISVWAILQRLGLIHALFYQVGDNNFDRYLSEGRVFGPFESPNYLAMFLLPVFYLSLYLSNFIKAKKNKYSFLILLLLPLLAIWFSASRAGLIALIVSFPVFLNYRFVNSQKSKDRKPFFGWLFVSSLALINLIYLYVSARKVTALTGGDEARVQIYQYALKLLKAHWLTGLGLGDFQNKIAAISSSDIGFQQYALPFALHPHNLLLAIWLNLGLIGLILFVILIVNLIKNCFKIDNPIRASLLAAIIAILAHGIFDTTYFKNDLSAIFWLIFALALIFKHENEKTV